MGRNFYLRGVGGWLAVLIAGLVIFGPLIGWGLLAEQILTAETALPGIAHLAQWVEYKRFVWALYAGQSWMMITAGYYLWRHHIPASVEFAKTTLWLAFPCASAIYAFVDIVVLNQPFEVAFGADRIGAIMGSAFGAGIWVFYLNHSVRVCRTYGIRMRRMIPAPSMRSRSDAVQALGETASFEAR